MAPPAKLGDSQIMFFMDFSYGWGVVVRRGSFVRAFYVSVRVAPAGPAAVPAGSPR